MKIIKTKALTSSLVLLTSMLVPLVALVPQVSAVTDTCTWTGGGTGVENTGDMTLTFSVSDSANWSCSVDGVAVPEAGDTLEFPANLADVDPGDTIDDNDEQQWQYIVDNDLAADTEIAGIQFTGTPMSSSVHQSRYSLTGNSITLSGDVTNEYTESDYIMGGSSGGGLFFGTITTTADVSIETRVGGRIGFVSYESVDLFYGSNMLTVSGPVAASEFQGTGDVILTGNGYPEIQVSNHNPIDPVSNFIIDENTRGTINIIGPVINKISSLIVRDGGQLSLLGSGFSEAASHDIELPMDITFEGTGQPNVSGGGVGAGGGAGGGEQTFTVDYEAGESYDSRSRIDVQTNGQSIGVYPFSYYKPVNLELSGEITFADSDLSITTNSDIDISGTISGEGNSVDPRNSVGIVTVSSTTNDSDSNGKLNVRKYTKQTYSGVFNETYTVIASSGQEVVLDDITLRDVVVQSFGKLSGSGGTAALFIAPDGIVAPGESPGCVETDGDLTLNGTYEFEIDNNTACTGYDQLDVTGAVDVTGATLELSLLDGYGFNEDDEFILINNDGSDEVTGEFTGLTEGDEIEVDGNTFVLSYEGGDGNDVSVLAASVSSENAGSAAEADAPDAPDTGVSSLISNPLAPFLSALLSLGAVVGVRKLNKANK